MPNDYLRTNEFQDVIHSMTMLEDALGKAADHPIYWKSVILFAHGVVQGTCVCFLTRTDGTGALSKKCEDATLAYLYGGDGEPRAQKGKPMPRFQNQGRLAFLS